MQEVGRRMGRAVGSLCDLHLWTRAPDDRCHSEGGFTIIIACSEVSGRLFRCETPEV